MRRGCGGCRRPERGRSRCRGLTPSRRLPSGRRAGWRARPRAADAGRFDPVVHPRADPRWLRPGGLVSGRPPHDAGHRRQRQRPDVRACALCHYPNGKGRPENAGVSGLPVAYFAQQMVDFRNGDRKSAEPRKANTGIMIAIAKAMTDEEINASAEYFGSMKWTPWINVVERRTCRRRASPAACSSLPEKRAEQSRSDNASSRRRRTRNAPKRCAIRVPDSSRTCRSAASRRARRSPPPAAGANDGVRRLPRRRAEGPRARSRDRRTLAELHRAADVRHADGRPPGVWTDLMKPVVAKLTDEDILNLAAYSASLPVAAAKR